MKSVVIEFVDTSAVSANLIRKLKPKTLALIKKQALLVGNFYNFNSYVVFHVVGTKHKTLIYDQTHLLQ